MKELSECILENVSIPGDQLHDISRHFESRQLEKGEFFVNPGTICRQLAYIESGYIRVFDNVDGKDVTLWIGSSGSFVTSLSSFVFETVNFWSIQAITPASLQIISRKDHFSLGEKYPKWLEFDNLLLARAYAILERNMFDQLHTTAKQRFDSLMELSPQIFNHVPLQYIASMLGITPETLSRLRKDDSLIS